MELSPLTLAQSHARNAQNSATPVAAVEEHDLAAAQFATAAKDTGNSEALRTLKLLEQHHTKLAQLIKFQNSHPVPQASGTLPDQKPTPQPPASPNISKLRESSPYLSQQHNSLPAHLPPRDISSSIASNLASARGIPSNKQRRDRQTSSPLIQTNAEARVLRRSKTDVTPKSIPEQLQRPAPPTPPIPLINRTDPRPPNAPSEPTPSRTDEPFQRFYSTFETLISKISAPLAFAGLPLTPSHDPDSASPATKDPSAQLKAPPSPTPASTDQPLTSIEPDYSKIFSRAALRALREEQGHHGGGFGTAAESFYVVPTTGGTISYADILARAQQEANLKLRSPNPNNTDDLRDDDEFVDARETPQPASPVLTRTGAGGKGGHGRPPPGTKTMEELVLENSALRALADQFSKRLAEFEMGAQTSSLALQTSIRATMARSQVSEPSAARAGDGEEKLKRLEEKMGGLKKEVERLGRENEKLRGVVGRYRERWEKLKEGARGRREGAAAAASGAGGGGIGARGDDV